MLELSTHLPNERHSEPRPIHTVLVKCAFSPNQQGTSSIRLNSVEPRVTAKLTCRYGAQRNSGQVERLVRQIGHVIFEIFFSAKNMTIAGIRRAMTFQTPIASKTT